MTGTESRPASWSALRGDPLLLARLLLVCFGVWLHAADGLMVVTMLPDIIAEIGGARFVSWTIALYQVGSVVAAACGGFLAMRFGLRAAMTGAALAYMAGCALSAMAPAMWVMLIGRLAQGLGGGGLVALSFVAVSLLFSRALMPRIMAAVSVLWGVSAFLGPLVGGVFAGFSMWRGGFWFFVAQAALLAGWIGLSAALSAGKTEAAAGVPPFGRLVILCLAVLAISWAGIEISPVETPLCFLIGILLLGIFLVRDGRDARRRLLPPRPLDARTGVGAGLLMVLCISAGTIAAGVYGPLLIRELYGASALVAGYVIAASSIGWSAMAILVAGVPERRDGTLVLAGMGIIAVSALGFMVAMPGGTLWWVLIFAALQGIGFGAAWTFILRRMTALAPPGEIERVASALPAVQRLGYALGAALTGIVANAAGVADVMDRATSQAVAFWIFAASLPLVGIGLIAAWRFVALAGRRRQIAAS